MKASALFLIGIIATSSSMLSHAAECSDDDLMSISEIYSQAMTDGTASCPDLTTATDASDYCSFTECLRFMTNMLDDLPDCTTGGVSIKEGVQAAIDICDGGTADMSNVFTDTSSSSMLTTDSSTDKPADATFSSDSSSNSATATDTASSSDSLLRTVSPSDSSTSDKITADQATGSSSASTVELTISSFGVAMTTFIFAVGL
ncbi:hypothetical protein GN244_ATG09706 [Phytophthora infestans]|uniref:Elicitin-like protein n=1 Tax=Phytophthora infestans TaxID=4787 RepID=A0A833TBK3_PHYIN|nr:hypothetical protein GN244_ATG09706 [Phytophthora infestans]KAF4142016.1 hypothetical protein GN958_ATG08798 [Phytophthora infestans]